MDNAAATDADSSLKPLPEIVEKISKPDRPSYKPKRKHIKTAARPRKKQRLLKRNGLSVPWKDGTKYDEAVQSLRIFPIPPLADTLMEYATRKGLLGVVVLGIAGTNIIEKLVADQEGVWQVPKVTSEFKCIAYKRKGQPYTKWSRDTDGPPVSPSTVPIVEEMPSSEGKDVIENGDSAVATNDEHASAFCHETGMARSPYEVV